MIKNLFRYGRGFFRSHKTTIFLWAISYFEINLILRSLPYKSEQLKNIIVTGIKYFCLFPPGQFFVQPPLLAPETDARLKLQKTARRRSAVPPMVFTPGCLFGRQAPCGGKECHGGPACSDAGVKSQVLSLRTLIMI